MMMSSPNPGGPNASSSVPPHMDIQWVPHLPDHFITTSTDLKLYKVTKKTLEDKYPLNFQTSQAFRISQQRVAEFQKGIPEPPHYIKCVALQEASAPNDPRSEDIRLAVGQANGRISLLSFQNDTQVLKEFSPKTLRQCNDLSWNPAQSHLLAAGFEKVRSDGAILIFDAEKTAVLSTIATASTSRFSLGLKEEKFECVKATTEMAMGESCTSLSWFKHYEVINPISHEVTSPPKSTPVPSEAVDNNNWGTSGNGNVLIAGMNNKHLKVFDIRADQFTKSCSLAYTRAVYNVCVDPFVDFRTASMVDNQVMIWDMRYFEKPIVTLNQSLKVSKLGWSPTRSGLLCSVGENGNFLTIHDIQSWSYALREGEPAVTERIVRGWHSPQPIENYSDDRFCSFAWHPTDETKIVAVTNDGRLSEVEVTERIAPSWSTEHCLIWAHGGNLRAFCRDSILYSEVGDISLSVQQRAKDGYGTSKNLAENAKFFEPSSPIAKAWNWLHDCGKLMEDLSFKNKFSKSMRYPGIATALGLEKRFSYTAPSLIKSEITYMPWNCGPNSNLKPKKMFRSENRETTQKMCGWSMDPADLTKFLTGCLNKGEYFRAAAVACFCLDVKAAMGILERGAAVTTDEKDAGTFNMTIISMSGFWEEKNPMWTQKVKLIAKQIKEPYLRSMFHFLSSDDNENDFSTIINDPEIRLSDKIAFSCSFLSDEKLSKLITIFRNEVFFKGDLSGLFLIGFGNEAVELLQRYLDLTGDIQTVCWMSVRCMPQEIAFSDVPQMWFDSYRNLLDSWRLWIERADFNIEVNAEKLNPNLTVQSQQQVFISCHYCGSDVSGQMKKKQQPDPMLPMTPVKFPPGAMQRRGSYSRSQVPGANPNNSNKPVRPQTCANCKKPLPRCAVCLVTMGSQSGSLLMDLSDDHDAKVNNAFDLLFTWCQTCRHGGHAGHLIRWYKLHNECPVSGCKCDCPSLDPFKVGIYGENEESPLTKSFTDMSVAVNTAKSGVQNTAVNTANGGTQTE